ncbi:DUF5131 family protein [Mesorhizobium sp. P5_C1]
MSAHTSPSGIPRIFVAIGTTCEDQKRWDLNVPALIEAKRNLRPIFAFVSAEPLLGEIRARAAPIPDGLRSWFRPRDTHYDPLDPAQHSLMRIDQIITGGESDQCKHRARPSNPQWYSYFRNDCAARGTIFHHKQNGEWVSVSEV